MIEFLLSQRANVDAQDYDGVSPLMLSAENGDVTGMRMLLDRGARPSVVDNRGYSALHHACAKHQVAAVSVLLETGADLNSPSYDGMFPLHILALLGFTDVATLLTQSHVDVRDADGRTPLHLAVVSGHAAFAAFLLEVGADADGRDTLGRAALHYATEAAVHGLEMVSQLIARLAHDYR
ncbi:ankyrin [Achlya hypogyna]|uniref:Ankyrin n=1 Tax=Achlya hypogyna TaxID=1202772 RepID=A0A1V9YD74_ACHHY|nr:ankyrin [Achlya hypogyna]